ncbi:MAG: phosphoribosyltransferase family protein [Candidatus Thorarchaeota archaeon]
MKWNQESFDEFIRNQKVIGIFDKPIKLASGRLSYWYVNWRKITSDAYLTDKLTDYIISFITYLGLNPKCFYGVPEGATKLGIITQFKWAKIQKNFNPGNYPISMGRGKQKNHGDPKDRVFIGLPEGDVVILEDVVTTGGSLLKTIKKLEEFNINIISVIGLTNRNELRDDRKNIKDIISQSNIPFFAMSNAIELLPHIEMKNGIKNNIIEYFKKYGTQEINFKNLNKKPLYKN